MVWQRIFGHSVPDGEVPPRIDHSHEESKMEASTSARESKLLDELFSASSNEDAISHLNMHSDDPKQIAEYLSLTMIPKAVESPVIDNIGWALTGEAYNNDELIGTLIKSHFDSPWKLVQGTEARQKLEQLYSKSEVFMQVASWLDGQPESSWPNPKEVPSDKGKEERDSKANPTFEVSSGSLRLGTSRLLQDTFQLDQPLSVMASELTLTKEQTQAIKLERAQMRKELVLPPWNDEEEHPLPQGSSDDNELASLPTEGIQSELQRDMPAISALDFKNLPGEGVNEE